jgi:hypothetical protein
VLLQAALNGPLTRADHPSVNLSELVHAAKALGAGAR